MTVTLLGISAITADRSGALDVAQILADRAYDDIQLRGDEPITDDAEWGFYVHRRLHGILRPSPASLHRLPPAVPVYVRNAREAQQLTDTGNIDPARVIHFDLPDHEQMSLI